MRRFGFSFWLVALAALLPCLASDQADTGSVRAPVEKANAASDVPRPVRLSMLAPDAASSHFSVRENVALDMTVEQVAATAHGAFRPFEETRVYGADRSQTTWLHFRVLADQPGQRPNWTLEFPKTYIDQLDFFYTDARGTWQRQSAGLDVAHARWPQRGLWPQFDLPPLRAGANDFYVRVLEQAPLVLPVRFQPTEQAHASSQRGLLEAGLILAIIFLMVLLSSVLAVVYRDSTYAWYVLYASLVFIAVAGFLGVAKRVLWAEQSGWPGYANLVFAMAAVAAQLQFCRAMFLNINPSAGLSAGVSASVLLTLLLAPLCGVFRDSPALPSALLAASTIVCFSFMLLLVLRAARFNRLIAVLWLLAYIPLMVLMIVRLLVYLVFTRSTDLSSTSFNWLPENILVHMLVFEVPVLLIALHLHAKAQHAREVHGSVLAAIDPLTGFVPPQRFEATLAACWRGAQRRQRDLAVAYIEVSQLASAGGPAPPPLSNPRTTARIVRMLRTAALEHDTVARLNPKVFALLMPGMPPGELLASRLARLVALSLMADGEAPQAGALRLRIVASTSRTFAGSWQELHQALQHKLQLSEGWSQRAIRFVRQERPPPPDPLDAMWERAIHASGLMTLAPVAEPDSAPGKIKA